MSHTARGERNPKLIQMTGCGLIILKNEVCNWELLVQTLSRLADSRLHIPRLTNNPSVINKVKILFREEFDKVSGTQK